MMSQMDHDSLAASAAINVRQEMSANYVQQEMFRPSKDNVHTPVAPMKEVTAESECKGPSDGSFSCKQDAKESLDKDQTGTISTNCKKHQICKRKREDIDEQEGGDKTTELATSGEGGQAGGHARGRGDGVSDSKAMTMVNSDHDDSGSARVSPTKKSRGSHVKERPEMHATARSGQRHWAVKCQDLRAEWTNKRIDAAFPLFEDQVRMCARSHIKSQHECLLRMLQITAIEGLISPAQFASDEAQSFLGWTGFTVIPERSEEFRARVEGLFEAKDSIKNNTVNNAFRRAGLVPECWTSAWRGHAAFHYRPQKRAVYTHRSSSLRASPPAPLLQPPAPDRFQWREETALLWNLAVQSCAALSGPAVSSGAGGFGSSSGGEGAQLPMDTRQPLVCSWPGALLNVGSGVPLHRDSGETRKSGAGALGAGGGTATGMPPSLCAAPMTTVQKLPTPRLPTSLVAALPVQRHAEQLSGAA
mmetsp:Transcript_43751/g.102961  ORF Transcript_43751/g.102961 Transcript_43751/m.102961 type:complete len:475 (-) Transcript_43751:320-1744(-)